MTTWRSGRSLVPAFGVALALVVSLSSTRALAQKDDSVDKSGNWACNDKEGYWYEDGVKSKYECGKGNSEDKGKDGTNDAGEKSPMCTASDDPGMPSTVTKYCVKGPPDGDARCWWTHVPDAVKDGTSKLPMIVDMHGGGGCASHQMGSSGFKELADSLGADETFIVAWPQGYGTQWGTCGTECDKSQAENGEKNVHSVDDITFLSDLVAHMVKTRDARVDAERVFASGFSMGCMMSHRIAMERSNIIAGFGCHGGRAIQMDSGDDLTAQKQKYDVQPMPAYMTGGTADEWFNETVSFTGWSTWNGCDKKVSAAVNLTAAATNNQPKTATLTKSTCGSPEVARLELAGGTHVPDSRMAAYTWDFLKSYKRAGAEAALGDDPGAYTPSSPSTTVATTTPMTLATTTPTTLATTTPTTVATTTPTTSAALAPAAEIMLAAMSLALALA